ncbi:MAG TPA: hypothetical protein VNV43_08500, partial [Candidatus Acidoferrales bacterium]|nr:hypothetical protein [Candidatus Acidoferrales bacterium]
LRLSPTGTRLHQEGTMRIWTQSISVILTLAAAMFCAGCIGPHYSNKELIVSGRQPPAIRGPHDPAIEANLSTNSWPKSPFPDRAAEVVVTVAKSAGIQGWKDYHMQANARGIAIQHEFSSNGFLTMDLRLQSLRINRVRIPLRGTRYMRLEIFLGKVSVDKAAYTQTNAVIAGQGKFVWDSDGWFEIHPQKTGDVELAPPHKSWYQYLRL